jgi:predicted N-formylglutamate amidohydrolase
MPPPSESSLLDKHEPVPFEVHSSAEPSPFLIVCDHAGAQLPRVLGSLGLSAHDLATHIAWDIGAAGVARHLALRLDAFLVLQRYSRLVIDCNRPLDAESSIVSVSGGILIPGNQSVSAGEALVRARSVFHPYHDQIRAELDRRERASRPTVLVSMHSFTPSLFGSDRPWHAGVLYNRDARLARPLLERLRLEEGLVIGDNQPYAASEHSDYTIIEHGERRGIVHVELEVRQDLIFGPAGQEAWAERLARLLRAAASAFLE